MKCRIPMLLFLYYFLVASPANANQVLSITNGTFNPYASYPEVVSGKIIALNNSPVVFCYFGIEAHIDGIDSFYSEDSSYYQEITTIGPTHLEFYISQIDYGPDRNNKLWSMSGRAYYASEYYQYGGGSGNQLENAYYDRIDLTIDLYNPGFSYLGSYTLTAEASPVPEPSTIVLLCAGLMGIVRLKK